MAILWTAFAIFIGTAFTVTGYFSPQRAVARACFGLAALTLSAIIITGMVETGHVAPWNICCAVLGCLATVGLFLAAWKWTSKVVVPQPLSPTVQSQPPQVQLTLRSTHETNNLKPIRFAIQEHGGYTTHYGKASLVTVSAFRSDAALFHLIDCRLINTKTGQDKTVTLHTLSSEATDVTSPLLELVHGSTNPNSVDWSPNPASYQVSVTIRCLFAGQGSEIGPSIYDVSTKSIGSLTLGVTVAPHVN
jgi:hypothetical protein